MTEWKRTIRLALAGAAPSNRDRLPGPEFFPALKAGA